MIKFTDLLEIDDDDIDENGNDDEEYIKLKEIENS